MTAALSGLLAAGLIQAVRPFFDLPAGMLETGDLPLFLLPAVVLVGLIAGCYPAFYLSAFDPVRVLKGSTLTGDSRSRIRGSLVLIQFAISIFLLIGTLTVTDQMRFILTRDLGSNIPTCWRPQDTRPVWDWVSRGPSARRGIFDLRDPERHCRWGRL